jgi:epoxyqueuosine reductase
MDRSEYTRHIKHIAAQLGFSYCGVARAEFLEDEAPRLSEWLAKGYAGKMNYLENHFDKRLDPTLLVPGAKSVVSLMYNYFPEEDLPAGQFRISKYAYGHDYHEVIREKLKQFMTILRESIGDIQGRVFVDSAPVMERVWAHRGGAGWIGKNSLLINKNMGSFYFLAELIIDLELDYDGPVKDYCGSCTACMDACPTDAIPAPYVVDGSRCISYFTIELKDEIPASMKGKFENWIFGCDICQDVCPWNRFSKPHGEKAFHPSEELKNLSDADWLEMTEEVFQTVFRNSPVNRTKFEGLKRNVAFIKPEN